MRNIDQTDFETGNVEFIEFWMQDPFKKSIKYGWNCISTLVIFRKMFEGWKTVF